MCIFLACTGNAPVSSSTSCSGHGILAESRACCHLSIFTPPLEQHRLFCPRTTLFSLEYLSAICPSTLSVDPAQILPFSPFAVAAYCLLPFLSRVYLTVHPALPPKAWNTGEGITSTKPPIIQQFSMSTGTPASPLLPIPPNFYLIIPLPNRLGFPH